MLDFSLCKPFIHNYSVNFITTGIFLKYVVFIFTYVISTLYFFNLEKTATYIILSGTYIFNENLIFKVRPYVNIQ